MTSIKIHLHFCFKVRTVILIARLALTLFIVFVLRAKSKYLHWIKLDFIFANTYHELTRISYIFLILFFKFISISYETLFINHIGSKKMESKSNTFKEERNVLRIVYLLPLKHTYIRLYINWMVDGVLSVSYNMIKLMPFAYLMHTYFLYGYS